MTHQVQPPKSVIQPYAALIPFLITAETIGGESMGLGIVTTRKGLASIDYVSQPACFGPQTPLAREVVRQLEEYFADGLTQFDLPLDLEGTAFQQQVWAAMCRIRPGTTQTYGDLANQLKSAAQAVGQACRRNPAPIVVPCHRVVSRQGIGGYAGEVAGKKLAIKQALLAHEGLLYEGLANG